jgi:hypothetical protein
MSKQNELLKFTRPTPEDLVDWWEWTSSIPEVNDKGQKHPFSEGGETNQNQTKGFICLACVGRRGGRDHDRKITVPAGKDILVPVFVASYSIVELPGKSVDRCLDQCVRETEKPRRLEFRVDNIIMDPYYVKTPVFRLKHPNACVTDLPTGFEAGHYDTMSAGYWCKVSLPKRDQPYIVKFGGTTDIDIGNGPTEFDTEVSYKVTVS